MRVTSLLEPYSEGTKNFPMRRKCPQIPVSKQPCVYVPHLNLKRVVILETQCWNNWLDWKVCELMKLEFLLIDRVKLDSDNWPCCRLTGSTSNRIVYPLYAIKICENTISSLWGEGAWLIRVFVIFNYCSYISIVSKEKKKKKKLNHR